ncbi:hypothetical protein AMATHDRAFT_2041 [Amanita thiersii Skay4041]|uniref:Anaphase-promoting complex subunit 4 WD40 domain-containing protein n=1 Tax=Amanita thiersii Skay4041 TaxID=703135 RepID=A0A2A9NNT1_9AGAR|nr:hypothetical protein AMATHDRAFT_2041 [Amanita thiersii Skay4041]
MPTPSDLPSPPRQALHNCTNDPETPSHDQQQKRLSAWLPTPPATGSRGKGSTKRRANADGEGAKKRVKLSKQKELEDPFLDSADSESSTSAYESEEGDDWTRFDNLKRHRRPRNGTNIPYSHISSLMKPLGTFQRSIQSTRVILESFVSSHKSDVYKCPSIDESTYLTPPYACAYSHAAKKGGVPLLAIVTEQGSLHILNTSRRKDWDIEPQRTTFQPHHNGIFDIKWDESDTRLVTCSGDHTVRITSLETESTTHILKGHSSTVKCVTWDPSHRELLASGGRDGSICVWDLRITKKREAMHSLNKELFCEPVMAIKGAHEEKHGGKAKGRRSKKEPLPKSITGLVYSNIAFPSLVSSAAFDGILLCWDLRQPASTRTRKPKPPSCSYSTPEDPTMLHGSKRPRGIISLAAGIGPTAGTLFALGADSRVHTYTVSRLEAQESIGFVHEHLQSSSFYVGLSVSPCGQWLASGGGTGMKGSGFLFDVANAAKPWKHQSLRGVELRGQTGEVGAVDWAQNMVASCADDGTVRIWRPDVEVFRTCMGQPEESKWDWCWAMDI